MDPERWQRVDSLYHQAAARTGDDRTTFLDEACDGDDALRRELESLLAHDDPAGSFLEEAALSVAAREVADQMPRLTGRRFGPYVVGELLGAGGMGDVYRAEDTVLRREVAIKILPDTFDADPGSLERFEQEARTLASLSHPHIAVIYGVQEAEGVRGLVLELVEGDTLADRIRRGPIQLGEALQIAHEIAEALDAAHQRGIVHRDLKPANIKITADRVTKILDFGLAQAAPVSPGTSGEPAPDAQREVIRGTAAYMSPEQARGEIVDKRTDIWAFGCVVYEMLTGRAPFARDTTTETVAAVLEGEPDWTLLSNIAPADLCLLVRRCLDKDAKRRRRDIGDVLSDLDALSRPSPASESVRRPQPSRAWFAVLIGAVTLLAIAAGAGVMWRPAVAPPSELLSNLSLVLPANMDFPSSEENQIAVSPDGTMIAYIAVAAGNAPRLLLKRLDTAETQILSDTIDARDPFFSPDGRWIGFFAGDTLRTLSIADGKSQVIAHVRSGADPSWVPGSIVFGEGGDVPDGGIRRVADSGGPVEMLSRPDRARGETNHLTPQVLSDGRTVLYTVRTIGPHGATFSVVVRPPGGTARVVVDDASHGRYVGAGALIYQRGHSLFVTAFDPKTLTASGAGTALFSDLSPSPNSARSIWAAGGDVLVYRPRNENLRFVWVTRHGSELSLPGPEQPYSSPSLSPNGDRIAVEIGNDGKFDIWLFDLARQALSRVTSDGVSRYPMWTPDGLHLGMVRRRTGSMDLYWQMADGTGVQPLVQGEYPSWIGSWTPDARTLIYMQDNPVTHSDLWAIDLNGQRAFRPLVQTPAREYGGRLSPDGRWLSYVSDETGRFELYVVPFQARHPRWQVSHGGAREAIWSRDGRELFYRDANRMMAVKVAGTETFSPGRPEVLFERDYFQTGSPGIMNYDVTPDGQRFLMLKRADNSGARLTVVQGFRQLIRQHMPPVR
jgi:eukaryotic-like serine/threonine-protein kinase